MIANVLEFTKTVLDQYLRNKFGLNHDVALINRLVDNNGNAPIENNNKVIVSLIHIDQDIDRQFYNRGQRAVDGNFTVEQPISQRLNLYVIVVPYFDDYNEGLKFLNASMEFFQENPVLSANNINMPNGVLKLEFQLEKGDGYMQMHNLWTALGATYRPSIIYKMRLITVNSSQTEGLNQEVKKTQ